MQFLEISQIWNCFILQDLVMIKRLLDFSLSVFVLICVWQCTQAQDVRVQQFSYQLSGAKFYWNKDLTVYFEVTIENAGAVEIPELSYPNTNFAADIVLSDAALETGPGDPMTLPFPADLEMEEKILRQALGAGETLVLTGHARVNVPSVSCGEVTHLCVQVKHGQGASYSDTSSLNNYKCVNVQSRMACTDDAVDLSVKYMAVINPTVAMETYVSVDLLLQVELYGSATVRPSQGDEYSITAYLSIDKQLNVTTDLQLVDLPKEFDKVTTEEFSTGGYLDVSGSGLVLPTNPEYCGPVNLIVHVDGGLNGVPGQIDELDEVNNIHTVKLVLLCEEDHFALRDFTYRLATNQLEIFEGVNTPVWVSATVYNTDPHYVPFQPGPANFKLTLWLSETQDIAGALEVTQAGLTYKSVQQSPQSAVATGNSITIRDALIWIDDAKFGADTRTNKKFIILNVEAADGSTWVDNVNVNNYEALPVVISTYPASGQLDFILHPDLQIAQNLASGQVIVTDGSVKPVTQMSSTKVPESGNTFSFVSYDENGALSGHMTFPGGFNLGNMFTKLYWSADAVFEPDTDELSTIQLSQSSYKGQGYIQATEGDFLRPPDNKNLCGVVYALVHVDVPGNERENLEHNNVVADMVRLQCDAADEFGLTAASYYHDVPSIWENVASRLYLSVDVSCTEIGCNKTGSSESFQLKLHLVTSAKDEQVELLSITSNSDIDDVTNGGLNAVFQETVLRQQITFSAEVTVSTSQCLPKYTLLGINLHPGDSYQDNDIIYLQLPQLICGETDTIDLKPSEFSIDDSVLSLGQRIPFSLEVEVTISGTSVLVNNGWPKFQFQLGLYDVDTGVSREIPYRLTECQYQELIKDYTTTSTITLDDNRGFILPEVGFETFCGSSSVMVFVSIDTYDPFPSDDIIGEVFETLETNNVMYTTATLMLDKNQMDCSKYLNLELPRLGTEVISFEGPDYIWGKQETTFNIQLAVINIHTAPIRGGSQTSKDYKIQAYLSGDSSRTGDDQHFRVTVSNSEEPQQYIGMEAGGMAVFTIQATLCQASTGGCIDENVLDDQTECPALQSEQPQILVGVGEIRLALEDLGFQPQLESHMIQVRCIKSVTPVIGSMAYSGTIYAEHSYAIPFSIEVINYSPHNPSNLFDGDEPKFLLKLYLSNNNDTSDLSGPNTQNMGVINTVANIPELDMVIDPGMSATLSSTAQLEVSVTTCAPLESGTLFVKAVIEIPSGGTFLNNGYTGGTDYVDLTTLTVDCSTDHIDLDVALFSLDDTLITLETPVEFDLNVQVITSGSASFTSGSPNYAASFFLSFDDELDEADLMVDSPFGSSQRADMSSAVTAGQTVSHELGSTGPSDSLTLSAAVGGKFCFQRDVFILVQLSILDGSVEPDHLNNVAVVPVSLFCAGDLFLLHSAGIQPLNLMEHSHLEMFLDVTIGNSHPDQVDIPSSINMEELFYVQLYTDAGTLIPLASITITKEDSTSLQYGIAVDETISLSGIRLEVVISTEICTEIQSVGSLTVRVRHGLGLADGFVDDLPENDAIVFDTATCSGNTADLYVDDFQITGPIESASGAFGSHPYELDIVLSLGGMMSFTSGAIKHFDFSIWLSHDEELSLSLDKQLPMDTSGINELTASYSQSENTINIQKSGDFGIIYPKDVQENYCGRSYLIVALDIDQSITETAETNNFGTTEVFLDCANDVYDLESVQIYSQNVYYPDLSAPFKVSFSVYNVQKSGSSIAQRISSDNYILRLYAQIGPEFDSKSATEIRDTWTVASEDTNQLRASLSHHSYHTYTMVTTEMTFTQSLCNIGVDHLIFGVESLEQNECLIYNNFYAYPVSCGGLDTVDIRVDLDRNNQPIFELIGDNIITLGELKPFALKVNINVQGNGGWTARSVGEGPVFIYQFVLSDGSNSLVLPHHLEVTEINAPTTASRVLDLGGSLNLTISNALLMCKSDLELTVYLDIEEDVEEYNELNNQQTITMVTVTDGGSGECDSGLDLEPHDLQLEPFVSLEIELGISIDYSFSFSVHAGPSAPPLASLVYSLYLTGDIRDQEHFVEIQGSEATHTIASGTEVSVTDLTMPADQLDLHQFCQGRPYLGVLIQASGGSVSEVDEENNVAWTQVILMCPGIYALGVVEFSLNSSSELVDSQESNIIFSITLLNKGQSLDANAENNLDLNIYLSASNDPETVSTETALVATFEGIDSPDRKSTFQSGDIWEYINAVTKFTVSNSDCVGKKYLCIEMTLRAEITDDPGDNMACVNVLSGPVVLDCARDIAVDSLSYTYVTSEIFQDTAVPLTFDIDLTFVGQTVEATPSPHMGFAVYLSDTNDLTPSSLNSGTVLRIDTEVVTEASVEEIEELAGPISDSQTLSIELSTEVTIVQEFCASTDRYVCVEYSWRSDLTPPFRDSNTNNDFMCQDIAAHLGCHNDTNDVEPVWLSFDDSSVIPVNQLVIFDLQVKVSLQGTGTEGAVHFEGAFYLSNKPNLDHTAVEIPYDGFNYGNAAIEMQRYLMTGDHVFNMGGVSINVTMDTSLHPELCGAAFGLFEADNNMRISERYETNNVIAAPILLQCPGDSLRLEVTHFTLPDGFWPDASLSLVQFDAIVQNIGLDLPLARLGSRNYMFELYASDSDTWGVGTQTLISDEEAGLEIIDRSMIDSPMSSAMKTAESHWLPGIKMYTTGQLLELSSCDSITHIFVCVRHTTHTETDTFSNNCQAQKVHPAGAIQCQPQSEQTDLWFSSIRLPQTITVPGSVSVQHDIAVSLGTAALPVDAGDFISALYLSRDSEWNPERAHKVADLTNAIDKAPGSYSVTKVTNTEVAFPSLPDASLCGDVYAYIKVDSEEDIVESSEINNVGHTRVMVLCDSAKDYFGLSDVHLAIPDGYLVEDTPVPFTMKATISCLHENCNVPMADTDNIVLHMTSNQGAETSHDFPEVTSDWWTVASGGSVHVPPRYWNSQSVDVPGIEDDDNKIKDEHLMQLVAFWESSDFVEMISRQDEPDTPFTSGYPTPGYSRTFLIHGTLTLPMEKCAESGVNSMTITVDFGPALEGETDGVPENNAVTLPVKCTADAQRDLIALPIEFWPHDLSCVECLHVLPTLSTCQLVLYNIPGSADDQGMTSPGVSEAGSKRDSPLSKFLSSGDSQHTSPKHLQRYLFSLPIQLMGASIPGIDAIPTAAPFTFGVFVSHDPVWSHDDIKLEYTLSHSTAGDLRHGLSGGETVILQEFVKGVTLPPNVCGYKYIIVHVDDTNRIREASEANNFAATRVFINCGEDVFKLASLHLNADPSETYWEGHQFTLSLDLTLDYNSPTDLQSNGQPAVEVQAYLSADDHWDPLSDVLLDSETQEEISGDFHRGDTIFLKDVSVNGSVTADDCSEGRYYLVVVALPFGRHSHRESILQNNWKALPLNVQCGGEVDLRVTSVGSGSQTTLTPGEEVTQLNVQIAQDDPDSLIEDSKLSVDLWISRDHLVDPRLDLAIQYTVGQTDFVLPEDIDHSFCGRVFLLAHVDPRNLVPEVDEDNNMGTEELIIKCDNDVLSIHSLSLSPTQTLGLTVPTPLFVEVRIECTVQPFLCPDVPSDPDQVHFTFQLKVYDRSGYELGDLTPGAIDTSWISTVTNDDDEFTMFSPTDGLRKSFKSVQEWRFTIQNTFQLTDPAVCEGVRYIGIEMVKGDGDEVSSYPSWQEMDKVANVPVNIVCSRSTVDLSVTSFSLADLTLNMSLGIIEVTDLTVDVTSSNMPAKSTDRPLFDFSYIVTGGDSGVVGPLAVDLHVEHSTSIINTLKRDWTSGQLTLTQPQINFNTALLTHWCGQQAQLKVSLDTENNVMEADESNNGNAVDVLVSGCQDGIDQKIREVTVPPIVHSGQTFTLAVTVDTVLVGPVGFIAPGDPTVYRYHLQLSLIDSTEDTQKVIPLKVDTSHLTELLEDLAPDSLETSQAGIATVHRHHLVDIAVTIPPDLILCDQSWFFKVEVMLHDGIANLELHPEDNIAVRHLHIVCPEDQLAFLSIEIVSLPSTWWSESTNMVQIYSHVINTGSDIINPLASSFSIKQYFSLDNELDEDDVELVLIDLENRNYEYWGNVATGHVINSGLLRGELKMDSKEMCEQAKASLAVPTLFWKLEATDAAWSTDVSNDVMKKRIDKSTLLCHTDNLDLAAYELDLHYPDNVLEDLDNIQFSFHFKIRKTSTAFIPTSNFQSTEVSFKFEFFLSNDAELGGDDVLVELTYTTDQLYILQQGVRVESEVQDAFIDGTNLNLSPEAHPEYAFYCGEAFLLVQIIDLKNVAIDPVPENNVLSTAVTLKCPEDLLSFESLSMKLVPPQKYFYHTTATKFSLSANIKSYSTEAVADSVDDRPIMEIRAFMSEDALLDVVKDPEIVIKADYLLDHQFTLGFDPMEDKLYEGFVDVFVSEVTCVYNPKYLIILIQKYSQLSNDEVVVANNYQYIPLENLFRCTKKNGDLWISNFTLTNGAEFEPDDEINFIFQIEANLYGETILAVKGTFDNTLAFLLPLDFQFYLSHDAEFDQSDYSVGYDLLSNPVMRGLYDQKSVVLVANSFYDADHLLTLPKTSPAEYCGHVYLLAVLDPLYLADEVNEHNNHQAIPIYITCYHDVFELTSSFPQPQALYQEGPGQFKILLSIYNALSEPITQETDSTYMDIKFFVQSSNNPTAVLHDVTPSEILDPFALPLDLTETIDAQTDYNFGFLEAFLDITAACVADRDLLESGSVRLFVEVVPGNNSQMSGYVDSVPVNNQIWTDIEVECEQGKIDLSVKDMEVNFMKFGPLTDRLEFGNNPFKFAVSAEVSGGAGWSLSRSDPDSPAKFSFNFFYSLAVDWLDDIFSYSGHLPYDMQSIKHIVNDDTTADRDIDLSDLDTGWVLERSDFLILCLLDPDSFIALSVYLDDSDLVTEVNEGNNQETILLKPPSEDTCSAGSDFSVHTWEVLDTQYDIVKTDVNHDFELKILLVLVQDVLNGLDGTDYRHFKVSLFLSHDQILDEEDVGFEVDWNDDQIAGLQIHARNFDMMDLSGDNLYIPLTSDTYRFCWSTIYLLADVDSENRKEEVNEGNNLGIYQVVLDCGAEVDECTAGYHDCHHHATCTDLEYHLYGIGHHGYLCECTEGYTGNGTYCENINECLENAPDGSVLHNCDTVDHSVCSDLIGSFECLCVTGYIDDADDVSVDGSSTSTVCVNVNECTEDTHNCDDNAECLDNIGSYDCVCNDGFEGDGVNCTNIEDCLAESCLNGATCRDDVSGVICDCDMWYEGERCEIANGNWGDWGQWGGCLAECGPGIRQRTRQCDNPEPANEGRPCITENNVGSLEEEYCQLMECEATFDWCLTDPCNQKRGGRCQLVNQGTSFVCSCLQGYRRVDDDSGDFLRCDDINECLEDSHDCSLVSTCKNTLGGFNCTCAPGFYGNGKICEDVDECKEGLAECDRNAVCVNVPLGYSCTCNEGYKEEKEGDPVTGKCLVKRLFDYGFEVGDTLVDTYSDITEERMSPPIAIPHGLPLEGETMLNALYVSENGIIVGTSDPVMHMNRPTYNQPRDFSTMTLDPSMNNLAIIAPFFADVETETDVSQIWYRSYVDTSDDLFTKVQAKLTQTVEVSQPMRFLLKVTWHKMKPHYRTEGAEFNTFQAVVATDYTHTYFLFLYDAGGMTWTPVYSAADVQIMYKGYPAWIGLISVKLDGTMKRPPQDPNSGTWSTDANEPNAYRIDSKISQSHNLTGVVVFKATDDDDESPAPFNPRVACYDWYQAEISHSLWAAELEGNCPSTETQAEQDPRFVSASGDRCYTRRFSLDSGSNIRCCYKAGTGSLVTALNTNSGVTLQSYTEAGFMHRYQKDVSATSSYSLLDVFPFEWCCLDSRAYSSHYCDWYLQRRPMSSAQHYDNLALGIVYGDPHFVTLDGLTFTYSGFGEYILLKSLPTAPVYMMVQARTDFMDTPGLFDDPKAAKLSAVSFQVGSTNSPVIQVYLKDDEDSGQLEVYVDSSKVTASTTPDIPGTVIDMDASAEPTWAKILYKEEIWIHVTANKVGDQELLKATLAMPTRYHGNHYHGILGSFDGDMENDLVTTLGTTLVDRASEATSDDISVWANSWSLRLVYGQSQSGPNARDKSLFTQYPESYSDAISYYHLTYNPSIFTEEDFTLEERELCTDGSSWSTECIHDYKVTNSSALGLRTLRDKQEFMLHKSRLSNTAPQFIGSDLQPLYLKLDEPLSLTIEVSDPNDPGEVTLRASIKDSNEEEMLDSTELALTLQSEGFYTATLQWTPQRRDSYTIELKALDSQSFTSSLQPSVILCACEEASCDYTKPHGWMDTFAYASCQCPAGKSGDFCSEDLDACVVMPCYTGECTDMSPAAAEEHNHQFVCSDCPVGTEGDGRACADINECVQHRHECNQTCTNTAVGRGYICSCGPGFQLSADELGCDDIQECITNTLNDCDLVHGSCLDDVPGSYSCVCKDGYELDPETNQCVDEDECVTNNGECQMMCFNTEGSYYCDCAVGFTLSGQSQCVEVNECELDPECDQECVNHVGYYECGCREGFTLHADRKRCVPDEPCTTLTCDHRVLCGIDDVTGVEKCFCPHGYTNHASNKSACIDVDECTQNKHDCNMNGECVNTVGGYVCHCKTGFQLSPSNNRRCYDIDECQGETVCEQVCVNYGGSYSCHCHSGYTLNVDGITCTDINECDQGQQNECSPLADCVNLNGSYECHCQPGFHGSGFICNDVDECLTGDVDCQGLCENNYGSYSCSCVAGYKLDPTDITDCIDINECNSPGFTCDHLCTNTPGSFTCSCRDGFTLVGSATCEAVDPCEEQCGGGLCYHDNNLVERCMCEAGYAQKNLFALDECLDKNECTLGVHTCDTTRHASCENIQGTAGGYLCVCEEGYKLNTDGISCSDINECTVHPAQCDPISTTCQNTEGGYTCHCEAGFYSHNATYCQDVDECRSPLLNDCRKTLGVGVCVNTAGGYQCHCTDGYHGNGKLCTDVDECLDPNANDCVSTQVCINSAGSYHCACKTGYKWDISTESCLDINECKSPVLNQCEDKASCINKEGSYRCDCYDGAVLSNDGRSCIVMNPCQNPSVCICNNMNEDCQPLCVRIDNFDTCICKYPYSMKDGVCQEVNECLLTNAEDQLLSPCDSHSKCIDKPAQEQFECHCQSPYLPDIDGLGCSETNGLWSAWSTWSSCSRTCGGFQSRSRFCSNPPPQGYGRMCEGEDAEYLLCNQDCHSSDEEFAAASFFHFYDVPSLEWHKVEGAVFKTIRDVLNWECLRDNITYSICCGEDIQQEDLPTVGDLISTDDIRLVGWYPWPIGEHTTQVGVLVTVQDNNQLCPTELNNRKKRDVSGNTGILSRSKRALDPVENRTYSILDKSLVEEVLNDTDTKTLLQKYLDLNGLLQTFGPLDYSVSDAVAITTTTISTPEEIPDDTVLTLWMILAIAGGAVLALILLVVFIVVVRKRKKQADLEAETGSRPVSVVSRKDFENDEESDVDSISLSGSSMTASSVGSSREMLRNDIGVVTPIPAYMRTSVDNKRKHRRQNSNYRDASRQSYTDSDGQESRQGHRDSDGQESRRGYREDPDEESTPEPQSRPVTRNTEGTLFDSRPCSTLPGTAGVQNKVAGRPEPEEKPKKKKKKKKKTTTPSEVVEEEKNTGKKKKQKKPPSF